VLRVRGEHLLVGPLVEDPGAARALGLVKRHARLPLARRRVLGRQADGATQHCEGRASLDVDRVAVLPRRL
jgi:hypothetical protein